MLSNKQIKTLIEEGELIENYFSLDIQVQPNGFDVTAGKLFKFDKEGAIDFSNSERAIPEAEEIKPEKEKDQDYGWWNLTQGSYKVRTNEKINLPKNLAAISFPRNSLLRMGAFVQTAGWDAGFGGPGEFILVVKNPKGVRIKENARLVQLIFFRLRKNSEGCGGSHSEL